MIKMQKAVPSVYYKQSRDFQFIARLYELVLNSVKTNSDMIYSLPNSKDANEAFLELLSTTLGFKSSHNYNVNQLKSLCSCFAEIIRNKGSIQAIEKACNALVGAEGITESVYIDDSDSKKGLILYVPQELTDTSLLRDLMNYILPAGLTYSIVKTLKVSEAISTEVKLSTDVKIITHGGSKTSVIKSTFTDIDAPNILDTSGMLINSTIIDTYGYEIQPATSMEVPNGTTTRTIELQNGYIGIENNQYSAGSKVVFTVHCESGYRLKNNNYTGIWLRIADNSVAAYQLSSSTDMSISHVTSSQDYTVTLKSMPAYSLNVIAEIEAGKS